MLAVSPSENICVFYFDVVCPFSYIAASRIEDIGRYAAATIDWRPVSLGGLYKLTEAPQGASGSATDASPPARQKVLAQDFEREIKRYQLTLKFHPQHPLKSIDAGRLICAFPPEHRGRLALLLCKSYWTDNNNIQSRNVLLRLARTLKIPSLPFALDESIFSDSEWHAQLKKNTEECFGRGGFGVPSFYIEGRTRDGETVKERGIFFGQDRMHLVEAHLLSNRLGKPLEQIPHLERLHPRCLRTPPEDRQRKLIFWFDFSSPWSYIGWSQLERIQREAGSALKIELKPFLLGGLFKAVGTPMVPMENFPEHKKAWTRKDMEDWADFWSAVNSQEYPPLPPLRLQWPDEFPIRSVHALRVALIDPAVVPTIFYAAWRDNQKISDPKTLAQILTAAGFEGKKLVEEASSGPTATAIKEKLKGNTDEAVELGLCGAPTFQVGKHLIWGQDRINVVQDLIAGWRPDKSKLKASVGAFPHFDYRL